ncbi:MAG TPA: integrase arm-type DNA-binding domain-containing protein [Rhizomicrobium sp.]|nr:integrase arm-type DNA-binding domain-containing protein [Rhizomicrobium sp.]
MGIRAIGRLSALKLKSLSEPGRYCDGGGLYLQVCSSGSRSWIFRYQLNKRIRDMGLGSAAVIGLADARDFAGQCRALVARQIDPVDERRKKQVLAAANATSFEECARRCFDQKKVEWRNEKHTKQWITTLEQYAFPVLGSTSVGGVDTPLVLKVLEPIWAAKHETATRVRERIEIVLDWARARNLREGDNPARWRGHLETLLSKPALVKKTRHHPALPFTEIGAFMAKLKVQEGMSARALELLIYTATRTSEVLGATWSEFDLDRGIWTIPAARIKAGREHRIPLSKPALALVRELDEKRVNEFVFPGWSLKVPLSNMAMLQLLKRMERGDITVHGFRSTFRDWAAEQTNFSRDVAEMALAHAVENKVEAAYRRGDLFEKRSRLMSAWAEYCGKVPINAAVIPLSAKFS